MAKKPTKQKKKDHPDKGKAKGLEKQAAGEIATKSKAAEKSQGKGKGVVAKKEAAKIVKLVPKDKKPKDKKPKGKKVEEVGEAQIRKDKKRLCIIAIVVTVIVAVVLAVVLL
jgi:cobalamin biosynthesis Mg chelatase CobN